MRTKTKKTDPEAAAIERVRAGEKRNFALQMPVEMFRELRLVAAACGESLPKFVRRSLRASLARYAPPARSLTAEGKRYWDKEEVSAALAADAAERKEDAGDE